MCPVWFPLKVFSLSTPDELTHYQWCLERIWVKKCELTPWASGNCSSDEADLSSSPSLAWMGASRLLRRLLVSLMASFPSPRATLPSGSTVTAAASSPTSTTSTATSRSRDRSSRLPSVGPKKQMHKIDWKFDGWPGPGGFIKLKIST